MPENNRTPSKFAQVAPAQSGQNTPSIRNNGDHLAETKSNLKKDVLQDSNVFPSLGGYAQEVEHEKEEHELHQRGISGDSPSNSKPVSRQDSTKEKPRDLEKEAMPHPSGAWAAGDVKEHILPANLSPKDLAFQKDASINKKQTRGEAEDLHETKSNLKPEALANSKIFPGLPEASEGKKAIDQENSAWQGKIPAAVKQPGEFQDADTTIIDEPAERAAGIAKYKQERKEKQLALKRGPFRWFKGEPRETWLERKFVGGVSSILGVGMSIVCGVLRLFGLRDLSGRFVMGVRNFVDRMIEGTFLRHFRSFGHQWWPYRLVVRIIRNIDRNVRVRIGPEPGRDVEEAVYNIHREGRESWETAKREAGKLRDETADVMKEARNQIKARKDEFIEANRSKK